MPDAGGNVAATGAPAQRVTLSHRTIIVMLVGLLLSNIMAGVEGTIVATARPSIVRDLGRFDLTVWVFTAYLLAQAATTNIWGKLSDLYGRQRFYQASILLFMCGSITCGLSTSMTMLIVGRAFQGAGAGGLFTLTMIIMADVLSPRDRGRYVGYMAASYGAATILGPLVGGLIVDHTSWRWIFFLMPPFGVAALLLSRASLKLPFTKRDHRIDWAGAILNTTWVASLVLLAQFGPKDGWTAPNVVALGVLTVASLIAFIWRQTKAPEPILPLVLFRERIFALTIAALFLLGVGLIAVSTMAPVFLQYVSGVNATNSGLLVVPMTLGMLLTSVITGRRLTTTGKYRKWPILGSAVMTISLFVLSTLGVGTGKLEPALAMFTFGLGFGSVSQVLAVAVQNKVAHKHLGIATSATAMSRSLGQVVGSAVYGAVLNARLDTWLEKLLPGQGLSSASITDPKDLLNQPEAVRSGIEQAFAHSLHTVFLLGVPLAFACFLVTWAVPEYPLRTQAAISDLQRHDEVDDIDSPSVAAADDRHGELGVDLLGGG